MDSLENSVLNVFLQKGIKLPFHWGAQWEGEKKLQLCVFCKLYNLSEYREPGKLDTYLGNLGDSCLLHFIREFHKMECSFVCESYYEWQGLQKYLAPQSNSKEVLSTVAARRIYALAHWDASFSAFVLSSVVLQWTLRWSGLHQHDLKEEEKIKPVDKLFINIILNIILNINLYFLTLYTYEFIIKTTLPCMCL